MMFKWCDGYRHGKTRSSKNWIENKTVNCTKVFNKADWVYYTVEAVIKM